MVMVCLLGYIIGTPSVQCQTTRIGLPLIDNFDRSFYNLGLHPLMMSQSKKGLIYGSNHESLISFDGHRWNRHQVPLWTNVLSVLAASDDKVYVGCTNTLGFFEYNAVGQLEFHSLLEKIPEAQRKFNEVWKIHETNFGIVFQSVNQLMIFDQDTVQIVPAPSSFHFSFYVGKTLYVIDNKKGILIYNKGNFINLPGAQSLVGKEITAMITIDQQLLIATQFDGLYYYQNQRLLPWNTTAAQQLKNDQVYCALRIDKNKIAFGTVQNGLMIVSNEGTPLLDLNVSDGLQSNTIQSMLVDSGGDLWVGTNNGVDLIRISRPLTQLKQPGGLGSGYSAVLHKGYLYLGTNRGVFFQRWVPNNSTLPTRPAPSYQLIPETKGQVWKLQVIDDQLLCGHHDGTFLIDRGQARKISEIKGVWTFLEIPSQPNQLLAGTYNGLILFEKDVNQWRFKHIIRGFDESSRIMAYDKDGTIWMSHGYKGIFHLQLNKKRDSVTHAVLYNSRNGFWTDHGLNLTTINEEIIFLTPNGVFEFNDGKILLAAAYENFFPYPEISSAIEDAAGNIWYCSRQTLGVKRLQEDGSFNDIRLPFQTIKNQFISGFEFIYPIDAQHVLIGTEEGFLRYNPSLTKNYQKPFNTYIRLIKSMRQDSVLFSGHMLRNDSMIQDLDYSQNNLLFSFYAADFEDFQNLEFATFLEGYGDSWSDWSSRSDREFTNLREGNYVLHVKAKNVYEKESNTVQYAFTINPPLHRSTFAYVLYFILFLFTIWLAWRLIKRQQLRLFWAREQELLKERMLAEQELIKLRNDKLREEVKNKDQELANSTMQIIQKNRFLNQLKEKLEGISSKSQDKKTQKQLLKLVRTFEKEHKNNSNWTLFEAHFANVHGEFLSKLKADYPALSPAELRLCACLRMNISSKEIAELLNISMRSVESGRYRLRKSLNLEREENLTEFILSI